MKSTCRVSYLTRTMFLFPLMFVVATVIRSSAASTVTPAEPKTHTLFMGTDISIQLGKKLYRIKDVSGSSFVVSVNGELRLVPMRGEPHNLNVEQSLKLAGVSASITDFKSERAYTVGNDPRMQRQREAAIVEAVIGDNASLAMGQYIAAQNKFGIALNANSTVTGAAESAHNLDVSAELASKKAFAASQVADAMMSSDLTGGAYARQRADTDLRKELFDAMEVDFTASSPTSLNKPYVVMVTRFHERDAKPGVWRNAIYAKALDPISGNSQKIHLLQGGFPRGFVVENCEIHLYNQGVEIPSDASPKRVSLSPSEAFEYLKIEYLSSHKGASHPAAPALGKLSAENRSKLSPAQLGEVYFVKVSPDGLPIAIFADEACSRPVDPVVGSVAENIRFYPALENGKRVEGVARLVLANISI